MAPFRWRGLVALLLALGVLLPGGSALALATRPQGIGPRPPTPAGVLINIPARTLYWYIDGELVRTFPVAVGKSASQTPVGSYRVQYKAKHPWWQPPKGGKVVPPGPANPLGTRWIQFNGGYGVHGNNNPDSIGTFVSLGCVRMYKEDVEWLYDQVAVGTPVTLVYEPVQVLYGKDGSRYLAIYLNGYGWRTPGVAEVLKQNGLDPETVIAQNPGLYPLDAKVTLNGSELEAVLHLGKPYVQARDLGGKVSVRVGWDADSNTVSLDGQALPTVLQGTAGYVDAAAAAALLGVEYGWDPQSGTAWMTGRSLYLNGHLLTRRVKTIDGQPYIPVRLVAEAAGAAVGWDNARRQALINGEPIETVLLGSTAYAPPDRLGQRLNLRVEELDGRMYLEQ